MFGWEFPPFNSGGLGTACFGLTRALSDEHISVIFVLPKKVSISSEFVRLKFADEFLPGVSVTAINSLLKPYISSSVYKKLRKGQDELYGLSLMEEVELYALRALELAKSSEFDVIHAHDWLSFGAGLEAKRVSGKPLVVHVHSTEFDRTGGSGAKSDVYEIEKRGIEGADKVIAVSHFTKRFVVKQYGVPPEKVMVVHNGIAPVRLEKEKAIQTHMRRLHALKGAGKKIVLFVGRVTLQKGPDYFLRAAAHVLAYSRDVCFVIAGSGDMEQQIIQEAAALGISDKVIFAGFLREGELDAMYRTADLFVMPSVSEPFGLTALEAVQNGTPVILSKQSGVSEVVAHSLKVDFWDIDAMADAIIAVLSYPPLQDTMRNNARQELHAITWQHAAKSCINIYQQLTPRMR